MDERTEIQTQTDRTKLIVAFRNFVNAPENLKATFMIFMEESQFGKLTGDPTLLLLTLLLLLLYYYYHYY